MTPDLRVVHLASGREWRGGQRQVWLLARGLAATGAVRQCVVTGRDSELARRLQADGLDVELAPWRAGLDPRVIPVAMRAVTPGTILHAHDSHSATLASVVARMRQVTLVGTRRVTFRLRANGPWHRADRLVAVSRAVADRMEKDGIPADRVTVVPSAVDLDALDASVSSGIRAQLGIAGDAPLVAMVGALTKEKGHDVLLQAATLLAKDLPALHWVLVGDGPLRKDLEKDATRRGLMDRVHFVGHVDEPASILRDVTLAVLPSREEGFGSTILEALALRVPVVGTDVGGIPETLAGGGGVLVPPDDAIALAEAVGGLVRDRGRRERLAAEARGAAEAFAVPRMVEAVLAVYRSVTHRVGGP